MKIHIGIKYGMDKYSKPKYTLVGSKFIDYDVVYEIESEEVFVNNYLAHGEVALQRAVEVIKALAHANSLVLHKGEDGVTRAV